MNIVNNNYAAKNLTSFRGVTDGIKTMRNKEEQTDFIIDRLLECTSRRIENEVPENGKFRPIAVYIDVPETQNEGRLYVEYDTLNPKDLRRLSLGVRRAASDRVTSVYLLKGTKKELIDYVNNSENKDKIIENINHLSDKTDEYYDSL